MTSLSRELQSLKEALERRDKADTKNEAAKGEVSDAIAALIAAIWVSSGEDAFRSLQRTMAMLGPAIDIERSFKNEIAAIQREEAVTAPPTHTPYPFRVGQQLTREEAETLPIGSIVACLENDGQVKCSDGLWHWECQGRHYTCNVLRHQGPYTVVAMQQPTPAPPAPGDRLTAEQLRDAPDGTVVRHPHDATMRYERMDGGWYMLAASTPSADLLSDNFWLLVRWGRA